MNNTLKTCYLLEQALAVKAYTSGTPVCTDGTHSSEYTNLKRIKVEEILFRFPEDVLKLSISISVLSHSQLRGTTDSLQTPYNIPPKPLLQRQHLNITRTKHTQVFTNPRKNYMANNLHRNIRFLFEDERYNSRDYPNFVCF